MRQCIYRASEDRVFRIVYHAKAISHMNAAISNVKESALKTMIKKRRAAVENVHSLGTVSGKQNVPNPGVGGPATDHI